MDVSKNRGKPPGCFPPKSSILKQEHTPPPQSKSTCNSTKDADLFYEDRKYCIRCLDKEKEKHQRHREKRLEYIEKYEDHKDDRKDYRKAYSQIEIDCEVCKCTVRKCNLAKHILTKKHKNM